MSYTFNEGPSIGISVQTLRDWISWQLGIWEAWAEEQPDEKWLQLETGNANHPTVSRMLLHAFGPVRRYAERILGSEPIDESGLEIDSFADLAGFARECLAIHANAEATFDTEQARTETPYQTRSAGIWTITAEEAFVHSLTHCFWHLGGIVQLLRSREIAPPQRSDLIFYAAGLHGNKDNQG